MLDQQVVGVVGIAAGGCLGWMLRVWWDVPAQVPALRVVDACGNQIKRVGAVSLAKAALSRPQLELLALDENMVSEAGLDEVRGWMDWGGRRMLQVMGSG